MNDPDTRSFDNWRGKGTTASDDRDQSLLNSINEESGHSNIWESTVLEEDLFENEQEKINTEKIIPEKNAEKNHLEKEGPEEINTNAPEKENPEKTNDEKDNSENKNPVNEDPEFKATTKKRGYYSTPQPNIVVDNGKAMHPRKRSSLLLNGNMRNAIPLHGIYYCLLNTCPFDTIVQILATGGIDDESYKTFVDVNSAASATMAFIRQFIDQGVTPALYKHRTILLTDLVKDQIKSPHEHPVSELFPRVLDLYGSTGDIWSKCFEAVPSGFETYSCGKCGK